MRFDSQIIYLALSFCVERIAFWKAEYCTEPMDRNGASPNVALHKIIYIICGRPRLKPHTRIKSAYLQSGFHVQGNQFPTFLFYQL